MTVATAIEAARPALTATEQRLADAIIANPARAATASVAGLAGEVGAHGASLVRLARKLGFNGFPELRAALHRETFQAHEPAERLRERIAQMPSGEILADLVRQETYALAALPETLGEAELDAAARCLCGALRVVACGEGNGRLLVEMLADRLGRLGRGALTPGMTPREIARALSGARPGDVLVAVALTRLPPVLGKAICEARAAGLSVILIADPDVAMHAPAADVVLRTLRGPASAAQTPVVPVVVATALVIAVSKHLGDAGLERAARYGHLRRALSGPQP